MCETSDTNFAAYLVMQHHSFTHRVVTDGGKTKVVFAFALSDADFGQAFSTYLNSEHQAFIDAQRRLRNVIRLALG